MLPNMSKYKTKYPGFTLIEMLLVMSIIVILTGMSFSAYQNMQTTIRLNEFVNSLEQNIRKIQRDAMLLEKKSNETWIYGLGVDLRGITTSSDGTFGAYYPFKWCSGFSDYGPIQTRSVVPNYDPGKGDYGFGNGPWSPTTPFPIHDSTNCANVNILLRYAPYGDSSIGIMGAGKQQVGVTIDNDVPEDGGVSVSPAFILFESVTGRAFFYDDSGYLLNFDYESMKPLSEARPLTIRIKPPRGGNGKKIIISHISGRILVEANDEP